MNAKNYRDVGARDQGPSIDNWQIRAVRNVHSKTGCGFKKPVAFDGYMFNIGGTYVAPKELETMRFELV
ncbi:hypothetical protein ACFS07_33050 [Undibacterium arcticum]